MSILQDIAASVAASVRNHSDVALVSSGATYSILGLPWGQIAGLLAAILAVMKIVKFSLDWYKGHTTKE